MTGQDSILAMRRRGKAPAFVWVSDRRTAFLSGLTVRLDPADIPEALDLRFLVGLTALVDGGDPERVDRIAKACAAVAKRVIANTTAGFHTVRITDTEGVMTWQK
jgi:hypothetical protein